MPEPVVPDSLPLVPDSFDAPDLAPDLDDFVVFLCFDDFVVVPVAEVSAAEPDDPVASVDLDDFDDFVDFLCLWCFFAGVPVALDVSEPIEPVPGVAV